MFTSYIIIYRDNISNQPTDNFQNLFNRIRAQAQLNLNQNIKMKIKFEFRLASAPIFSDDLSYNTHLRKKDYNDLNKMRKFIIDYYEDPSEYSPEVEEGQYIITSTTCNTIHGYKIYTDKFILTDLKLVSQNGDLKKFEVTPIKKLKMIKEMYYGKFDPIHDIGFYRGKSYRQYKNLKKLS